MVGEIQISGITAALPGTVTEVQSEQAYQLTELGVYVANLDAGEVLFQVYQLSSAVAVTEGSKKMLRLYLCQNITVTCSPLVGVLVVKDLEPLRSKLYDSSVLKRTVCVGADDQQAYLDERPRLLTEKLKIHVGNGAIKGLKISGLFGSAFFADIR